MCIRDSPERDEVDPMVNEQLVGERYSRLLILIPNRRRCFLFLRAPPSLFSCDTFFVTINLTNE